MSRFRMLLLLCLVPLVSIGQKLELDRVTKEELLQKKHQTDTTAAAAFLFRKAKTKFRYDEQDGFVSFTEFQIKLKVYKKEGLEWANFRMPYYVGYQKLNDESIKIVSAFTYNLENDKIVRNKVASEGKFVEQINEYWKVKSLTFPNVKVGSIIELKYELKTENLSTLPDFQYQFDIPVNDVEYITEIPEYYIYKGIQKGFVNVSKEEKLESTVQSFDDKYHRSNSISFRQIKTKYTAKNVPAIKEENYVNNIENYLGKIVHELQIVRMPDQEPKQIATTWEAVAKTIFEEKDFNEAISKFDYFANDIKSTINGVTSTEERAKKIFSFLRSRMNWNGKYGYYPRRAMNVAYAERVGNVGEINLMLVSMLRMAGVDANPVLVSTRDNGLATFPNKTLFNYVIAAAAIDGNTILMDATDKLSDMNRLPIRALNWEGRLIKKDGTSAEINLMPKSNSNKITNVMGTITAQGELSGKVRMHYSDYNALAFREKYNGMAKESYIEKKEKEHPGLEIKEYEVQNSIDLNLPIIENYSFNSTNAVEIIGDKMYLSPFIFFALSENPFKQENREYPVDFVYPNQQKFNMNLSIPDGYIVEVLPQPKAVAMPENIGNFKYNITNNGKQIQLLYTQDINQAVIESEYYEILKNFFKQIVEVQTEKIVLKKV